MKLLTDAEKEILRIDKINGEEFREFLIEINTEFKEYFNLQSEGKRTITDYFYLLTNMMPPAIRLRYISGKKLEDEIKLKVVEKYKSIFGQYADYQII